MSDCPRIWRANLFIPKNCHNTSQEYKKIARKGCGRWDEEVVGIFLACLGLEADGGVCHIHDAARSGIVAKAARHLFFNCPPGYFLIFSTASKGTRVVRKLLILAALL